MNTTERNHYEQHAGWIFDVQRYSLHDGPGLRTDVFFKGCPLHCAWCSNPESQHPYPELAMFAARCFRCGQFIESCPEAWKDRLTGEWEDDFSRRADFCPGGGVTWIGRHVTAGSVMAEVLRDAAFYGEGGGLTLTGGEPLLQAQFAEALLQLAKEEGIPTAIETTGLAPWSTWEPLLPLLGLVLFDVKHIDSALHKTYTGVGNELILSNLRRLAELGVPLRVRVPLIPGFNTEPGVLAGIAKIASELGTAVQGVDLLPYHTFGKGKYDALGREYAWANTARLTPAEAEPMAEAFRQQGLPVTIGG